MNKERVTRPIPKRTAPHRDFSGLFNQQDGQQAPPGSKESNSSEELSRYQQVEDELIQAGLDAARKYAGLGANTIEDGYKVIDNLASDNNESTSSNQAGQDSSTMQQKGIADLLTESMVTVIKVWFETMQTVYNLADTGEKTQQPNTSSNTSQQAHNGADDQAVAVELLVECNRQIKVSTNWRDAVPFADLTVQGPYRLNSANNSSEVIPEVEFTALEYRNALLLSVKVPEKCQDGQYAGIIYSADGQDYGYLQLSIAKTE